MEKPFEKLPGVQAVLSGYTGGHMVGPSYGEVCAGTTGHLEAVRVLYDPSHISYQELLEVFWRQIDPTDDGGQFVDRGPQYRSAVFVRDATERTVAEASRAALAASGRFSRPLVTEILPTTDFYVAEDEHQDYHRKQPAQYRRYRQGSGRDAFLKRIWSGSAASPWENFQRPPEAALRQRLTRLQYHVIREDGTEPAFQNEFWDHHEAGLYVDVLSGEPLFDSRDKFESGTGWPSFTRPLPGAQIVERVDSSHGITRVEVRSGRADSHLGHVFPDGPAPTGRRYCINSAALRFVPRAIPVPSR